MTYLLELDEIVLIDKKDTYMVGIWSDGSVQVVNGMYSIACLVFSLAHDTLWNTIIVTFLLKTRGVK